LGAAYFGKLDIGGAGEAVLGGEYGGSVADWKNSSAGLLP
jgi:hypothetical protein